MKTETKTMCNRCKEPSCMHNAFFVPEKAVPNRYGIPYNKCPYTFGFIRNDIIYITLRYWVKETFFNKRPLKRRFPFPFKYTKNGQSKGVRYSIPAMIFNESINIIKRPGGIVDQWCKKRREKMLKDFYRTITRHKNIESYEIYVSNRLSDFGKRSDDRINGLGGINER